jgi:membrane-bound lytic murein transglycosylase
VRTNPSFVFQKLAEKGELAMDISAPQTVALWELALIAASRGAIGFGAGLLISDKLGKKKRKVVGWSLFLTGLASTIPIAFHVFGGKHETVKEH